MMTDAFLRRHVDIIVGWIWWIIIVIAITCIFVALGHTMAYIMGQSFEYGSGMSNGLVMGWVVFWRPKSKNKTDGIDKPNNTD